MENSVIFLTYSMLICCSLSVHVVSTSIGGGGGGGRGCERESRITVVGECWNWVGSLAIETLFLGLHYNDNADWLLQP